MSYMPVAVIREYLDRFFDTQDAFSDFGEPVRSPCPSLTGFTSSWAMNNPRLNDALARSGTSESLSTKKTSVLVTWPMVGRHIVVNHFNHVSFTSQVRSCCSEDQWRSTLVFTHLSFDRESNLWCERRPGVSGSPNPKNFRCHNVVPSLRYRSRTSELQCFSADASCRVHVRAAETLKLPPSPSWVEMFRDWFSVFDFPM